MKQMTQLSVMIFMILAVATTACASEKNDMASSGAVSGIKQEASSFTDAEVQMAIEKQLDKKAEFTGKVDIYDSNEDKVRHLNLVKIHEGVQRQENVYTSKVEFTDDETNEIVILNASLKNKDGLLAFDGIALNEVLPAPEVVKKEWSDDAVMALMREFIEEKTKISGTLDMFDPTAQKVLNLDFTEFAGELRRFGKLFIATANCKERSSNKVAAVDVTVENKDNKLTLKSIRLKK